MTSSDPSRTRLPCLPFVSRHPKGCKEIKMLDALMVVAGVAFFVVAIAYVTACYRM
jgi:hypothetical protein